MLNEREVDLREEVKETEEEAIPELNELRDEIIDEATDKYDDWKEVPKSYMADVQQLEEKVKELRGRVEMFSEIIDESDEPVFVLRELSAAQKYRIVDDVTEKSYDVDLQTGDWDGAPLQGHGVILTLEEVVVEAPDSLPDNVGDYPSRLTDWLEDEVDDLLTSGSEVDMEDFTDFKEAFAVRNS